LGVLLVAALLVVMAASWAPAGPTPVPKSGGPADPLATLKAGHWVRLEGEIPGDSTGVCEELRVLTGDFLDDDWSLRGFVTALDTARHEFVIGGIRVQVNENTTFDSDKREFRTFAEVRKGFLLEVEGTYLKNRRFLAREVDDESDDRGTPWAPRRLRVVARIERLDARKRLITAMGFVFQLTDRTQVRSVIE